MKSKRPAKTCGNIAYVELTKGYTAIVDASNADFLAQWNWCVSDGRCGKIYAKRNEKGKTIRMHREILNAPYHMEVDHIDGDGLNNRASNLRMLDQSQNKKNCKMRSPKSGLKGAYWHKHRSKWQANIGIGGKVIYLGIFDTAEDAHNAYCEASKIHHGEYGRTK